MFNPVLAVCEQEKKTKYDNMAFVMVNHFAVLSSIYLGGFRLFSL